ncbi:RagB/SusD family nutrient uptake outer membrane protein [Flavobacterium olei]|uniref:RagB/SusD family nutrient uptake outer membrane protein n=1 Tax=Flavobacterium olei TaxID=1886782 RepID=UPI0032191FB0
MKTINFKKFRLEALALGSLLIVSCSNFTDIDLPVSQLSSDAVFENKGAADAAMTDIYSKIREKGLLTGSRTGLSGQLGLYSDELQYYGLSGTSQSNFYSNTLFASGSEISELWNSSYNQVYAANAVLEGVARSSFSASEKGQLKGEALFVRGLVCFYLSNTFGAVPFLTSTDYKLNGTASAIPEKQAYILIKKDLEEASELLPADYIGTERVRPNKFAALALLARVCLYMELWEEASNNASAVINQTGLYKWPLSNEGVFLKESTSTIWQLMPSKAGSNTYEGNIFIFLQGPPPNNAITADLVNAFSNIDLRKKNWLKAVANSTKVWFHAYKYKQRSSTPTSLEYSIVLRLAEQYLIRSESRAHFGDLIGAKEDLNKVRTLAGLSDTSAQTSQQIVDAVLQERRLELFTEFGHRFFDLKRTSRLDSELPPIKPQWKSKCRVLPIPQSELLLNPNLTQNAEY